MNTRPLLLGHRGVRGLRYGVRENTIAAFDLALQYGCDGFEFDVRLTADGAAVICHNPKASGTIIGKASIGQIRALPLLDDVLARYAGRAFLDIELKVAGLEACLLSALAKHPPKKRYVVSSFVPEILFEFSTREKSIPLGLICEARRELQRWPELPIQYVIVKQSLISAKLIADVHRADKKLIVWTVNRRDTMLRMSTLGIDGIISDKADLLVRTLGNRDTWSGVR
ncbi:MAG TPA: glycerophosphodiester phosphodiesterase [Terriglobales bacterium]|nr:glycerophosphodiester phosphodiesterase [Terriglobales bacterium]